MPWLLFLGVLLWGPVVLAQTPPSAALQAQTTQLLGNISTIFGRAFSANQERLLVRSITVFCGTPPEQRPHNAELLTDDILRMIGQTATTQQREILQKSLTK